MEYIFLAVKARVNTMDADAAVVAAAMSRPNCTDCTDSGTLHHNTHRTRADTMYLAVQRAYVRRIST